MEMQNCPQCDEENPAKAAMCWACYTPLGAVEATVEVETRLQKLGRVASESLPYLLAAALTASGWTGRRARWPILGAGLASVGALVLRQKWEERQSASPPVEITGPDESPIVRIAQTILHYASVENASAIRLRENGRGVDVRYQCAGEWHQQMKIPLYVWRPLRQQLLDYARQGAVQSSIFNARVGDVNFAMSALRADLHSAANDETMELLFEQVSVVRANAAMKLAPNAKCQTCREENAPNALWCWNCYAEIETLRVQQLRQSASEISAVTAMVSIFGALGSSGWWPRRVRLWSLGAGALGLAGAFAWCPLQSHFKKSKAGRDTPDEAPVAGVAAMIFARALQTHSTHIRLQERGNVRVSLFDEAGVMHAEIALPAYMWPALRNSLMDNARKGVCLLGAEKRLLKARLSCSAEGETLDVRLDEIEQIIWKQRAA